MGVDIHIYLLSPDGKEEIEIKWVRCPEWFKLITERNLGMYKTFPPSMPKTEILKGFQKVKEEEYFGYCYDFNYILVSDFLKWGEKMAPEVIWGWVSRKAHWNYINRGILPETIYDSAYQIAASTGRNLEYIKTDYISDTFRDENENSYKLMKEVQKIRKEKQITDISRWYLCYFFDR